MSNSPYISVDDQVSSYSGDKTVLYGILTRPKGTEIWYWVKFKQWDISNKDYWLEDPQNPTGWGIKQPEMEKREQSGWFFMITRQPYTGKFIKKYGYNFIFNECINFEKMLERASSNAYKQHIYIASGTPYVKLAPTGDFYIFERPYEVKCITSTKLNQKLKITQERVDFIEKLYKEFVKLSNSITNHKHITKFTWFASTLKAGITTEIDEEYKKVFNTKYSLSVWNDRFMQVIRYLQQLEYVKIIQTENGSMIDLTPGFLKISTTPEGVEAIASMY